MKIKDSVFMVTGGASGLGEATVRRCVELGGRAAILDLNTERGAALVSELDGKAIFLEVNVTDENSVREAVEQTVKQLGAVNVLVNCAGIGLPQKVLSKRGVATLELFQQVITVNLVGTFNVLRLAAEKMAGNEEDENGERGVVINTASVAAFDGQVGQVSYSASKGGVVAMTLPLARELASHGIRVMTIAPGVFETPMFANLPGEIRDKLVQSTPFPKRLGRPAEYAFLVQGIVENPMLNGETIRIDGAIRMEPR